MKIDRSARSPTTRSASVRPRRWPRSPMRPDAARRRDSRSQSARPARHHAAEGFVLRSRAGRHAPTASPPRSRRLPKSERSGLFTVESKKGESFASIAREERRRRAPARALQSEAQAAEERQSRAGPDGAGPDVRGRRRGASRPGSGDRALRSSVGRSSTMHVVKSGETLGGIAKKYTRRRPSLMTANGLDDAR